MSGQRAVTIGVTGHRALPNPEALVPQVDDALDVLSDGAAVHLLTSLADGADRLVAHRVLTRADGTIEVVLPLEPADYEADFTDPASVDDFRALLELATTVEVVDGVGDDRVARYEAAGLAVVERSEALLALWDGRPALWSGGGTAEIVERARQLGREVLVVAVDR